MYALMVFLCLLATAAFLHVFVYRRRRYLPLFVAVLAPMLYTHNWALFFDGRRGGRARALLAARGRRRGLVPTR